ncbi:MAG TPA: hypothetical protein VE990_13815 [Acidimicrobiales bacterium]|nr:hypothetical protein [Acidimicrobiales bacterium]
MASVQVSRQGDGTFRVDVGAEGTSTRHVVSVAAGYQAELGWAGVRTEALIEASFGFLLQREPATSILTRFSLDQIERYFPEYRREMAGQARRGQEGAR